MTSREGGAENVAADATRAAERCGYLMCVSGPACELEFGHEGWHKNDRDSWAWSIVRARNLAEWLHGDPRLSADLGGAA